MATEKQSKYGYVYSISVDVDVDVDTVCYIYFLLCIAILYFCVLQLQLSDGLPVLASSYLLFCYAATAAAAVINVVDDGGIVLDTDIGVNSFEPDQLNEEHQEDHCIDEDGVRCQTEGRGGSFGSCEAVQHVDRCDEYTGDGV
jgi:hypothetical protein